VGFVVRGVRAATRSFWRCGLIWENRAKISIGGTGVASCRQVRESGMASISQLNPYQCDQCGTANIVAAPVLYQQGTRAYSGTFRTGPSQYYSAREKFLYQLLLHAGIDLKKQTLDREAAVLRQGRAELLHHSAETGNAVLHPCGDDWSLQQVLHIGRQLGSFHHAEPAILVGIFGDPVGVLQNFMVDRNQHALD